MKIAIFSDTFFPQVNGVANVAFHSAKILARRGHEVKVFTVGSRKKRHLVQEKANGFEVIYAPSIPAVYPGERMALPGSFKVFSKLKKFEPDIIHSHTPIFLGIASLIATRISHAVLIGTHHTFYDHYLKYIKADFDWAKRLSWKITVAFYNRCKAVISPTQSLADELTTHGLKRPIFILPNSIDTNFYKPSSKQKKINNSFVYMGRLSYEKSIDQVVKAFALVNKKIPDSTLTIIGNGPAKDDLQKLATKLKISKNVSFPGFLYGKNLLSALRKYEVFVTASKSENMPLSVLETMAAGLPVIAANEKGFKEIISNGKNGFLVKADSPKSFAEKMTYLIVDKKRLQKFSDTSRKLALNYSEENIGELLENIYKKALAKAKPKK